MSIIKIEKRLTDQLTLNANFPRRVVSSSVDGVTGSVELFQERSAALKRQRLNRPDAPAADSGYQLTFEDATKDYRAALKGGVATDLAGVTQQVVEKINQLPQAPAPFASFSALRFESPFLYDVNYAAFSAVKKTLYPYYRKTFRDYDYSFRNYHALNFFTSSDVPENACLIYAEDTKNSPYDLTGPFTFDFYINPRYTTDQPGGTFQAGTILHLSSTYALSLVTGSSLDNFGKPRGYRIMLQLSKSADVPPSNVDLTAANNTRTGDQEFIFVSDDNSLTRNHWHHVAVRWGTNTVNEGSGTFFIDNERKGNFVVPSSSIDVSDTVTTLFVGAKYNGANSTADNSDLTYFFSADRQVLNGTPNLSTTNNINTANISLTNPLNAEFHDLKVFKEARSSDQIYSSSIGSIDSLADEPNLLFFLPPFFVKESPARTVLYTPYDEATGTSTSTPFEVTQSMGLRVQYNSLENYTREFVRGLYPIPWALTGSAQARGARKDPMEALYELPEVRRRNLTVLPNDNGKFGPKFDLLASGTLTDYTSSASPMSQFVSDFGNLDLSRVTLRNLVNRDEQKDLYNPNADTSKWLSEFDRSRPGEPTIIGNDSATRALSDANFLAVVDHPKLPINGLGSPYSLPVDTTDEYSRSELADNVGIDGTLSIAQVGRITPTTVHLGAYAASFGLAMPFLLQEFDSVEASFFNLPNLLYGEKIEENTISLSDLSMTGSAGKVKVTLRDDSGRLYRADAETEHAEWNDVGNAFYDEGILVVKSPNLPRFGKSSFELELSGTRSVHVLELNIPCPAGQMDSSSNPTYRLLKPNDYANETSDRFSYVTAVNLHDENLNIIGKAVFSQPIRKRPNDGFFTRIKIDY